MKNAKSEVNVFKNSNKLTTNLKSTKNFSSANLSKKNDKFTTNPTKMASSNKVGLTKQ